MFASNFANLLAEMHLPSVKTKRYGEQGGWRRYTGRFRTVALQQLQSSVLHFRSTRPSLLLFGISSVCRYQMCFNVFPEELSLMRCLIFLNVFIPEEFFFPCCVKACVCPKLSLLGVVRDQPWTVLLHLPPDNQEHLCHVLRKLFTEKYATRDSKEDMWQRSIG